MKSVSTFLRLSILNILVSALVAGVAAAQSARPQMTIPAIAKAANGAIVSIIMSDKDGSPIAQGSGFLISNDGVILTNYHVIAEGTSAIVKLPDGAFYVVDGVLATDKARDIAVIKAHGQNFRTLPLGNSDRVQVGENVVAIGNPLSLESTVSNGIVSGIRAVQEEGGKYLQITAPISPGSSGGPLFNMAGEVIGITTMYLKGGENLNFAIPINDAKRLLLADSKVRNFPVESEIDISTKVWKHPGSTTPEKTKVWIEKDHLYESSEPWSFPNQENVANSGSCDTVRGATPKLGTSGLYAGECTYSFKWIKESVTCTVKTVEIITSVSPNAILGWSQHIDYSPLRRTPPTCPIAGIDGEAFALEPIGPGNTPSSVAAPTAKTNPSARDYYQQLYDAGAFSHGLPNRVCFSDDANPGTFFTFEATAYDERYYNAQAKLPTFEQAQAAGFPNVTPAEEIQFDIMETVQRTAPYVTFLMKGLLESYPPEAQQFFRSGGRILDETVYEKGVKVSTLQYRWDGSSWFLPIPPADPNAYTKTSKILRLSIEPTTMRYADSTTVTITVGNGATAATDTSRYGPWAGVCEKVPNLK